MTAVSSKARNFAGDAHGDQKYGVYPYIKHLDDVAIWLQIFSLANSSAVIEAAYLHDVIEDTDVTFDQISKEFGLKVAQIVYAVTNEPGATRQERNAATWPKISADPEALSVKLADRIANVFICIQNSDPKLSMYREEYGAFRNALCDFWDLDHAPAWSFLDRLIIRTKGGTTNRV
jgi:(p)ppGpp synthase/HD superfamily hydrolase